MSFDPDDLSALSNFSSEIFKPERVTIPVPISPAESTYDRLREYIHKFEADLDDDHEVGAKLVSFGAGVTFHIMGLGYYAPDIISFYGIGEDGQRFQLIQNVNQLSVLLIAMEKLEEKPRRIGFIKKDE